MGERNKINFKGRLEAHDVGSGRSSSGEIRWNLIGREGYEFTLGNLCLF